MQIDCRPLNAAIECPVPNSPTAKPSNDEVHMCDQRRHVNKDVCRYSCLYPESQMEKQVQPRIPFAQKRYSYCLFITAIVGQLFIFVGIQTQNEMESEIKRAWNRMSTALGSETCPAPELIFGKPPSFGLTIHRINRPRRIPTVPLNSVLWKCSPRKNTLTAKDWF